MAPVRIRYQTLEVGDHDIHLRTLRDRTQYEDANGVAKDLGISSANWPLFGMVWDAGRVLADLMVDYDVAGRTVLEVGCGIGLASLVLTGRDVNITATDRHPEAERFLRANAALNGHSTIPFVRTGWDDARSTLSRFDLIIGSDLLYERGHARSLSGFIDRHANPTCEVIIVDPGRPGRGPFGRHMDDLGYTHTRRRPVPAPWLHAPFPGQIMTFTR